MTETIVNPFADIADAMEAAGIDTSVADKNNFKEFPPAREGKALFRFVSYIETGMHEVQKGQGKGKKQRWADFTFELVHPDHMIGEGDKARPDTIELRNINVSTNKKAKYHKLFKEMDAGRGYKTFPRMLGMAFYGDLVHNKVDDKTYVNMEKDGLYLIGPPVYDANTDPLASPDMREINVPPSTRDIQCFVYDNPKITVAPERLKAMWDSIEIVGQKEDGTPYKNWIQDKIRSALDFEGSYVQSVIGGEAIVAADVAADVAAATEAAVTGATADTVVVDDVVDTTAAEAAGATVVDAPVDPLADIPGL